MVQLSLEDLNRGIHGVRGRAASTSVKGIEHLLTALIDPCNDPAPFAMESARYAGESDRYAQFAETALADTMNNISLLKAVKSKYGIEGLNPYSFGAEDVKDVIKTVGAAVKGAFQKLIQAVANFIRWVMNTIRGALMKGQTKWYAENKKEIETALAKAKTNDTIKVRSMSKKAIEAGKNAKGFAQSLRGIVQAVGMKVKDFKKAIASGNQQNYVSVVADMLTKQLITNLGKSLGLSNISENDIKVSADGKMPDAGKLVNKAVFGEEKTAFTTVTLKAWSAENGAGAIAFFDQYLTEGFYTEIKDSQEAAKALINSLKEAMKEADAVDAAASKGDQKKQAASGKAMRFFMFTRNVYGWINSLQLKWVSAKLSKRSLAYSQAKAVLKAGEE